jgi:hypothetical protein
MTESLVLDFAKWSVADYEAFTLASLTGDAVTVADKLTKLIISWDIQTASPSDPTAYGLLSLRDIGRILKAVNETARKMLYEGESGPGFEIDITGWNYSAFTDYSKAVSVNDYDTMFDYLKKVLKAWPFSSKFERKALELLNYEQYCQLNNAIKDAVKDALQGN